MRERTSLRSFVRELRSHAPELIEAVRRLPAVLAARLQRQPLTPHPVAPAPTAPADLTELREELRATARRRDAVVVGAALLASGIVWLAVARHPQWLGWALLAAGLVKILYGSWR